MSTLNANNLRLEARYLLIHEALGFQDFLIPFCSLLDYLSLFKTFFFFPLQTVQILNTKLENSVWCFSLNAWCWCCVTWVNIKFKHSKCLRREMTEPLWWNLLAKTYKEYTRRTKKRRSVKKIKEKQQRKGDGRRHQRCILCRQTLQRKQRPKNPTQKGRSPSSHLWHAAFLPVCYGRTIVHKLSFRQVSSLSSALLGHPLPTQMPACKISPLIPAFSIEFLTELYFCKSSDALCNIYLVGRWVSKQSKRVGSFTHICWSLQTFYVLVKNVLCSSGQAGRMVMQRDRSHFVSTLSKQTDFVFYFKISCISHDDRMWSSCFSGKGTVGHRNIFLKYVLMHLGSLVSWSPKQKSENIINL